MMSIYKYLTYSLLLFFCGTVNAQTPSFFKSLGKGTGVKSQCECVSETGNLSIGYYKASKDTLYFISWNATTKNWENANKIQSDGQFTNYTSKCIYKKDSLIVFTKYKENGNSKSGLFYVNNTSINLIAEIVTKSPGNSITDLKLYKNSLLVFGNYDSIGLSTSKIKSNNASIFNGLNWKSLNFNLNQVNYEFKNLPTALYNDTALIITANSGIVKLFISPISLWFPFNFKQPILSEITSVTSLGNNWLITRKDVDSMIFIAGEKISYVSYKNRLSSSIHVINTPIGTYISEDGLNGRILKMDNLNKTFQNLYISSGSDSVSNQLISNPLAPQIYFSSGNAIYYKNDHFGTIAEIDPSMEKQVSMDTVSLFVYNDVNGNLTLDAGETIINTISLTEVGSKRVIKFQNGFHRDIIPDYNDGEYLIINIEGLDCFQPAFTGGLRSINTVANITHDSLFFPLKKITVGNIFVKSSAKACARILDTITLNIKVFVDDCGNSNFNSDVSLLLDSNTVLLNSTPPFIGRNGNKVNFNLNNINASSPGNISLNVMYPIDKFKIDQFVKHKVIINNSIADDTIDNIDSIVQKIVYSYDPNAKHCVPSGSIKGGLKTIRYYIDFQNEGNAEARRVTVIDTLEAKIPVYEFQMVYSSHPYTVSLTNNVLKWVFDNINLPSKNVNEEASQGHIIFEARLKKELAIGDSLRNKAYIYFDYNEPIETNTAIVVRGKDDPDEHHGEVDDQNSLKVFPNPSRSAVSFENRSDKPQDVKIFNTLGQEVRRFNLNTLESLMEPVENWPRGMYFVRSSLGSHHKLLIQ